MFMGVSVDNWMFTWNNIHTELCLLFLFCLCGCLCGQLNIQEICPIILCCLCVSSWTTEQPPEKISNMSFAHCFQSAFVGVLADNCTSTWSKMHIDGQYEWEKMVSIFQNDCTLPCVWRRCPPCFFHWLRHHQSCTILYSAAPYFWIFFAFSKHLGVHFISRSTLYGNYS